MFVFHLGYAFPIEFSCEAWGDYDWMTIIRTGPYTWVIVEEGSGYFVSPD